MIVESLLRWFDDEHMELVLRWRIWRSRWLPYRTAAFLGCDEDTGELHLGPWEWNKPDRWRKHGKA